MNHTSETDTEQSTLPPHGAVDRSLHTSETDNSPDLVQFLKAYAREKPDVAALWCFGIGFVVGWKLKPW